MDSIPWLNCITVAAVLTFQHVLPIFGQNTQVSSTIAPYQDAEEDYYLKPKILVSSDANDIDFYSFPYNQEVDNYMHNTLNGHMSPTMYMYWLSSKNATHYCQLAIGTAKRQIHPFLSQFLC